MNAAPARPPTRSAPQASGGVGRMQFSDDNGVFASDSTFYFIQGDGWTSLRCNWPTSDPAIAGALWNNNGALSISNG